MRCRRPGPRRGAERERPRRAGARRRSRRPELLPAEPPPAAKGPKRRATAEQMATKQREISISEFFTKNRHLLGFDNPSKALLTTIKEAVDNSLDACEEAGILPEITIEVRDLALNAKGEGDLTKGEGAFVVVVEDNGPGIVKAQVPKIFGKLLYGSKFHRLKQSRGQQGIGISAAAMYGQLTTGQPDPRDRRGPASRSRRTTSRSRSTPGRTTRWSRRTTSSTTWHQEHGTRVELEIVANWQAGQRFVNRYVEHTALSNPHCTLHYVRPRAGAALVPAGDGGAAQGGGGDQAAPARRRARRADAHGGRLEEPRREGLPPDRLLARVRVGRRRDRAARRDQGPGATARPRRGSRARGEAAHRRSARRRS